MSYRPPAPTGDSLTDYLNRLEDFVNISPRLLEAQTPMGFEVWFEKLELIDRSALIFFIKKHKNEIPGNYLNLVKYRLPKDLVEQLKGEGKLHE